jgi:hypothetical protein
VVHLRGSEAKMQAQYQALLADEIASFRQAVASHRMMQRFGGGRSNFAAFGLASASGRPWHSRNFDFNGHGGLRDGDLESSVAAMACLADCS